MPAFETYRDAFPHAKLVRSPAGVPEIILHTNGDSLTFNGQTHEEFGSIRGCTFVLARQVIAAEEARTLGIVSEIVSRDRLLPRAREIAEPIAGLPPLTASYTRLALTQKLRRVIDENVGYGLALEGISAAEIARSRGLGE